MKNSLINLVSDLMGGEESGQNWGPVTLCIGGTIISGNVISKASFYEAAQNKRLKTMRDSIVKVAEDNGLLENEPESGEFEPEETLYLKDAFYITGNRRIPFEGGIYIAVNLESIDAFNIGALETAKSI